MNTYQKDLINKYLNGTLTGEEFMEVQRLILDDDEFNDRLETRKALKQVADMQDELEQRKELEEWQNKRSSKPLIRRYALTGIAAAAVLAIGYLLLPYYQGLNTPKEISLKADLYEVNFDPVNGAGFGDDSSQNRKVLSGRIGIRFMKDNNRKDTTYKIMNGDSLSIKIPAISKDFEKQNFNVLYDYKRDQTVLVIAKDTFLLSNSEKYEKLIKIRK